MDLDEYLWRKKIAVKDFAQKVGISKESMSLIKNKKQIPKVDTAIRIVMASDFKIRFEELLPDQRKRLLMKWIEVYENAVESN